MRRTRVDKRFSPRPGPSTRTHGGINNTQQLPAPTHYLEIRTLIGQPIAALKGWGSPHDGSFSIESIAEGLVIHDVSPNQGASHLAIGALKPLAGGSNNPPAGVEPTTAPVKKEKEKKKKVADKDVPCKFWLAGNCTKEACLFGHPPKDVDELATELENLEDMEINDAVAAISESKSLVAKIVDGEVISGLTSGVPVTATDNTIPDVVPLSSARITPSSPSPMGGSLMGDSTTESDMGVHMTIKGDVDRLLVGTVLTPITMADNIRLNYLVDGKKQSLCLWFNSKCHIFVTKSKSKDQAIKLTSIRRVEEPEFVVNIADHISDTVRSDISDLVRDLTDYFAL